MHLWRSGLPDERPYLPALASPAALERLGLAPGARSQELSALGRGALGAT